MTIGKGIAFGSLFFSVALICIFAPAASFIAIVLGVIGSMSIAEAD